MQETEDTGSIPPEEEIVTPLQYSCLGNLTDRGAWLVTVHGVEKGLDLTQQPHTHTQCLYTAHVSFIQMVSYCTRRFKLFPFNYLGKIPCQYIQIPVSFFTAQYFTQSFFVFLAYVASNAVRSFAGRGKKFLYAP